MAVNRALPLLPSGGRGGAGTSKFSVLVSAATPCAVGALRAALSVGRFGSSRLRTGRCRCIIGRWQWEVSVFVSASPARCWFSVFSEPTSTLGVILVMGGSAGVLGLESSRNAHPRAHTNPINSPDMNSCESSFLISSSITSASLAQATAVVDARRAVPRTGISVVDDCPTHASAMRGCERATRARIGSKSTRNYRYQGPNWQNRQVSRGRINSQVTHHSRLS
jgi:hypothetical protein